MSEAFDFEYMLKVVGAVVGVSSLLVTAINTGTNIKTNRAKFWLDLRDCFSRHDRVHRLLRPGGLWAKGDGPNNSEDWADVEAYMGLFEHCEIMLKERLIDEKTFKEIYDYRLRNIVGNKAIREEKLVSRKDSWKRFLDLLKRFEIELPSDKER